MAEQEQEQASLLAGLRRVVADGLAGICERRGCSEEEAAGLVGEWLGLPACQVLSWARNVPLGAPVFELWCPAVERAERARERTPLRCRRCQCRLPAGVLNCPHCGALVVNEPK